MSKNRINRTGRSTLGPRHVRLYYWLMETQGVEEFLNGNQRAIYVGWLRDTQAKDRTTDAIAYSIREAAESLRIGKSTAARSLQALQERGFVVAMTKGAFSRKIRHATEWRLTEFQCDVSGQSATKEFVYWKAEV